MIRSFLSRLLSTAPQAATQGAGPGTLIDLSDPNVLEYLRAGSVSVISAMKNPAVFRSVDLIGGVMGAIPLTLMRIAPNAGAQPATDHPLYPILTHRPNGWQSALQFKQTMQYWALVYGNACAMIVRSRGAIVAMHPIHPNRMRVEQQPDFSLQYQVSRPNGAVTYLSAADVLHIRGPSDDGYSGFSRVRLAADIIEIGVQSQLAASRVFRNGMMVGGALQHPGKLSPEAYNRLRASIEERSGAQRAGEWIITEEGMQAKPFASTAIDAQLVEMRKGLTEDIGRVFGVPRPLLGVDDTSWGSGIEQLAILFVRFGLMPWMRAWEEEIKVKCLPPTQWDTHAPDFQERELLRGTLKDQFEAYAKAAGAGGHQPWMTANEIREDIGIGRHAAGDDLSRAGEKNEQANPA